MNTIELKKLKKGDRVKITGTLHKEDRGIIGGLGKITMFFVSDFIPTCKVRMDVGFLHTALVKNVEKL